MFLLDHKETFLLFSIYLFIKLFITDQDPEIKPLMELDSEAIAKMFPEIPLWVKNPDFDRVCFSTSS